MKRFAIIIGSEDYNDFNPTPFCHKDVDDLYDTLVGKCDYAEQDALKLKLSPSKNFSPNNIINKIKELLNKSQDGDTILFFYAGHGDFYNDESYLILPNTKAENKEKTALPLRDISEILSKNKRLNIRIFDTCHSGQDTRRNGISKIDSSGFTRSILQQKLEGAITFASCKENEVSYSDPGIKNGVFTHYLVEGINEYNEEENITPELLKIKICDKVASWCLNNGKIQTPTYISFVYGNVSIASRRKVIKTKSTIKNEKKIKKLTLSERLGAVRNIDLIGGQNHIEILKKSMTAFSKKLKEDAPGIDIFGKKIEFEEPTKCDEIPVFLKKKIICQFDKERPLHEIRVEREYEKESNYAVITSALKALSGYEKKIIREEFIIKQSSSFPESFIMGKIKTDGYVPDCGIFLYLVPLQLVAAAIYGQYFDRSFQNENSSIIITTIEKQIFSISDIQEPKFLNLAEIIWARFKEDINKEMENRINYLEWEIKSANN